MYFFAQAYIKRRRLPTFKKGEEANKNDAKEKLIENSNGKAHGHGTHGHGQSSKAVGKVIANIMTNASAACYIGQNGLYQTKSQENGKGKSLNGHSNGFNSSNGHTDGNLDKKEL